MNRSTVISMVQDLTEHRADKRINFDHLLNQRLILFVQEKQFWWRKKILSLYTIAGTPTYDITQSGQDANGNPFPEISDLETFCGKPTVWNAGTMIAELEPDFDIEDISEAQEDTTQDVPTSYCIEPGTVSTIRLMSTPDGIYKVKFPYWACPSPSDDEEEDAIPLIPSVYHHALVNGLKMDVVGFLYGVKSDLYVVAKGDYQESVSKAEARQDFGTSKLQFVIGDDQIASTAGN